MNHEIYIKEEPSEANASNEEVAVKTESEIGTLARFKEESEALESIDEETKKGRVSPCLEFKEEPLEDKNKIVGSVKELEYCVPGSPTGTAVPATYSSLDVTGHRGSIGQSNKWEKVKAVDALPPSGTKATVGLTQGALKLNNGKSDVKVDYASGLITNNSASSNATSSLSVEPLKCLKCEETFEMKGSLAGHMLTHTSQDTIPSPSDNKGNQYCSRSSVGKTKLFRCGICDYETVRKDYLKAHLLNHTNARLYRCSECGYETNRKNNLRDHVLVHTKSKVFRCHECHYETDRKGNLKNHSFVHTKVKLLKCSDCEYQTNWKNNLKLHILTHTNTKLLKCSKCQYSTNRRDYLKAHFLNHGLLKQFACPQCPYQTNRRNNLNDHLLIHGQVKVYKCTDCDYGTNIISHLRRHTLKHSDSKLYGCSSCNYKTNRKDELKNHDLKHSGTKLFACPTCGYKTNRKFCLNSHMLTHNVAKLYSCSQCPYGTNRKDRLKYHVSKHEQSSEAGGSATNPPDNTRLGALESPADMP